MNENDNDYLKQVQEAFRKAQEEASKYPYNNGPYRSQPCPSCGHCPICGRSTQPFYPGNGPWITYTTCYSSASCTCPSCISK